MATPVVRQTRVVHGQRRSFLVGGEGPPLLLEFLATTEPVAHDRESRRALPAQPDPVRLAADRDAA